MTHPSLIRHARPGLVLLVAAVALVSGTPDRPVSAGTPIHGKAMVRLVSTHQQQGQRVPGGLEGGTDWINVEGPIHLDDLKGKIVLLDFWTFCCINCHHVIPDLEFLEKKYPNELVVIGVHTPKFPAERETENLRKKVAEYRIKHPVINDANQILWGRFGIESWPTLLLIDARGNVIGAAPGEGNREVLDKAIGELVKKHKAAKELDTRPFVVRAESEKPHNGPLKYPGKILADGPGKRLFISDTGHNRVVVTTLTGKHVETIGSGNEGREDGPFVTASFNRPQGLCLVGETLYVADTESHAIRAVDLKARTVTTIAGTGEQSNRRKVSGPGKTTALNSPWDLILLPGTQTLAIAMAGPHQIWKLDLNDGEVSIWAGTGREDIIDGTLATAAFAQPSGLATDGKHLYVADSEVSGVRSIGLEGASKGRVASIVGVGLFGFGDLDGRGPEVRLQHCLGLAYGDGKLYIADTYNNKIKVCDPATRTVKALAGTRDGGTSDDPAQFDEPGGLSLVGSTLYVADTNNHAIRTLDITTGKAKTLALSRGGLTAPPRPKATPKFSRATMLQVAEKKVEPGKDVAIDVALTIPNGFKLNAEAPLLYLIESPDAPDALAEGTATTAVQIDPPAENFTIKVPLAKASVAGETLKIKLSLSVFVCKKGSQGFCTVNNFVWSLPVTFAEDGEKKISINNETKP